MTSGLKLGVFKKRASISQRGSHEIMLSYTDASWVTVSSYTVKVGRRNKKRKKENFTPRRVRRSKCWFIESHLGDRKSIPEERKAFCMNYFCFFKKKKKTPGLRVKNSTYDWHGTSRKIDLPSRQLFPLFLTCLAASGCRTIGPSVPFLAVIHGRTWLCGEEAGPSPPSWTVPSQKKKKS